MSQENGNLKKLAPFLSLHFFCHFYISPQISYLSLFFLGKGVTQQELGFIMGIAPAASILGQYVWSNRSDKSKSINSVIVLITAASLVLTPLFFIASGFVQFLMILFIQNFFIGAVCPLADTLSIQYATAEKMNFGKMRLMGSLGFLLCMLLAGVTTGYNLSSIFVIQIIAGIALLIMLQTVPKVKMPRLQKRLFNPRPVLKENPVIILSLILGYIIFFAFGIHWSFFSPYFVNTLGAPNYYIGLCSVCSITCEVIFLLNLNRLIKRINLKYLIVAGALLTATRWLVYGSTTNLIVIILMSCVDGITAICLNYFLAFYLTKVAPAEGKVSLLMFVSIMTSGLGKMTGSFFGPMIISSFGGMQNTYLLMSVLVFLPTLIFLLSRYRFKNMSED